MLACIRRANLDTMAGKSPLTIRGHLVETIVVLRNAERINRTPLHIVPAIPSLWATRSAWDWQ